MRASIKQVPCSTTTPLPRDTNRKNPRCFHNNLQETQQIITCLLFYKSQWEATITPSLVITEEETIMTVKYHSREDPDKTVIVEVTVIVGVIITTETQVIMDQVVMATEMAQAMGTMDHEATATMVTMAMALEDGSLVRKEKVARKEKERKEKEKGVTPQMTNSPMISTLLVTLKKKKMTRIKIPLEEEILKMSTIITTEVIITGIITIIEIIITETTIITMTPVDYMLNT